MRRPVIPTVASSAERLAPIALAHPGTWIERDRPGYAEHASYIEPYRNDAIAGRPQDGIYVSILSLPPRGLVLTGSAIRPDSGRAQTSLIDEYREYADARRAAWQWLALARAFVELPEHQAVFALFERLRYLLKSQLDPAILKTVQTLALAGRLASGLEPNGDRSFSLRSCFSR